MEGFIIGLFVGGLVVWFLMRQRQASLAREIDSLKAEAQRAAVLEEKAANLEAMRDQMQQAFQALAAEALRANSEQLAARTRDVLDAMLRQTVSDWERRSSMSSGR